MNTKKSLSGSSFGILGDSYSSFQGYIPEGNLYYYPAPEKVDDVLAVEDTWWHILMQRNNMHLVLNDSYSGSTVCENVRENHPKTGAFTARAKKYFSGDVHMDYIFIFGGTNDSWLDRPAGQLQYSDWTEEDLMQVLPAYCYVLDHITRHNPDTVVVSVFNTGLLPDIAAGMEQACNHYGIISVKPAEIHKMHGHPNAQGMRDIAQAVEAALK